MAKKKHWRKIVVDDVEYTWLVGKTVVVIRKDSKVVSKVGLDLLMGESWHVIEHDQHKCNFHVRPSNVATWIEKNSCLQG